MTQLETNPTGGDTAVPQSYEARCKARAYAIHQRLMNPKNAVEEKVRPLPVTIPAFSMLAERRPMRVMDYSTALAIKEMYYTGVEVETIAGRFGIDKRSISRIRNKYGWPVRERPSRAAEE